MPLPLTGTTRVAIRLLGLVEQVGLAAGPQSLNVIVPCAGPPSVTGLAGVPIDPAGLAPAGPPVPGCFAVGPRVAVSLSAFVISTFAETKSGWLRTDLIDRVKNTSGKPVEHVVHRDAPTPVRA